MASHQHLSETDSSPGLVTSFPPQLIQASPQIEPASHSAQTDLRAERERAERLGHHFSRVRVLSDRPPTDPIQPFQLSIQRQIASQQEQQDPQAEAEQHSSLSEQEQMTLISVLQEIREVSLPAADFVSGAVYQWLYNNGETGRWLLQATSPEWQEIDQQAEAALPDSEAFELGRALGDGASVITGLAEIGKGGGAIAGGGTLCVAGAAPTAGGSCLAGGAAVAVGAALVVHGAGTTTAGVQGLAERLGIFFSKGSDKPDGNTSSSDDQTTSGSLPNHEDANIHKAKFERYSMDPNNPNNGGKWEAFEEIGYDVHTETGRQSGAQDVISQLTDQLSNAPATPNKKNRFSVETDIIGPNGKQGTLVTVWMYDEGQNTPRLVTNWLKVHR